MATWATGCQIASNTYKRNTSPPLLFCLHFIGFVLLGHHPNSSLLASPKDIAVMVAISAIKLTVAQLTQVALCTFFARKKMFLPCHSQSLLACDQHVFVEKKIVMSLLRLRSTLYPNDKVICTMANHIFQNAQVTSNKMVHKKDTNFWHSFPYPFTWCDPLRCKC